MSAADEPLPSSASGCYAYQDVRILWRGSDDAAQVLLEIRWRDQVIARKPLARNDNELSFEVRSANDPRQRIAGQVAFHPDNRQLRLLQLRTPQGAVQDVLLADIPTTPVPADPPAAVGGL